jgi:hypothetical protein
MIGRRAVIGLSLLSALLVCAFAAQGASAAEKESENTTAFTCVKDAVNKNGDFKDEHCDETGVIGKEEFRHDLIPLKTNTKIEGTNDKVTDRINEKKEVEKTVLPESAILRGEVLKVKTEITCKTVITDGTKSFIENTEPKEKNHKVTGTARNEFKECEVKKPAKCTIREPVVSEATFVGVDGLLDPKSGKENAMGVRFKGEIVNGENKDVFANILYQGAECGLKNLEVPVRGSAIATSGPTTESSQENKESGATLVFTPKFKMQNLVFGVNTAEFETIVTPRMAAIEGKQQSPIALTTTT